MDTLPTLSWGASWGERGFARVAMLDDGYGACMMYQVIVMHIAPSFYLIGILSDLLDMRLLVCSIV